MDEKGASVVPEIPLFKPFSDKPQVSELSETGVRRRGV
jgi:hypothetical protein